MIPSIPRYKNGQPIRRGDLVRQRSLGPICQVVNFDFDRGTIQMCDFISGGMLGPAIQFEDARATFIFAGISADAATFLRERLSKTSARTNRRRAALRSMAAQIHTLRLERDEARSVPIIRAAGDELARIAKEQIEQAGLSREQTTELLRAAGAPEQVFRELVPEFDPNVYNAGPKTDVFQLHTVLAARDLSKAVKAVRLDGGDDLLLELDPSKANQVRFVLDETRHLWDQIDETLREVHGDSGRGGTQDVRPFPIGEQA